MAAACFGAGGGCICAAVCWSSHSLQPWLTCKSASADMFISQCFSGWRLGQGGASWSTGVVAGKHLLDSQPEGRWAACLTSWPCLASPAYVHFVAELLLLVLSSRLCIHAWHGHESSSLQHSLSPACQVLSRDRCDLSSSGNPTQNVHMWAQERAYVTGLRAANFVVDHLKAGKPAAILDTEADEPHIAIGKAFNRTVRSMIEGIGLPQPFL